MFVWVLQLAYFCSLCVSLPLPQTRDSTYPPFLLNTVFPLCDGECNYFPGYRVTTQEPDREGREDSTTTSSTTTTNAPSTTTTTTTTTIVTTTTTVSTTISTTAEPQTSTVFASCDGDCPRFPEYKAKVVSDDDESDLTQSSTVFVPPVGTPTTSSVGSTSSTTEASSPEINTPPATETTTETTATDATETPTTPVPETTSTPGTTVTTTPGPSPITESSTTTVAATSTTKNVSVENSTTDDTDDAVKTSEGKDATKGSTD